MLERNLSEERDTLKKKEKKKENLVLLLDTFIIVVEMNMNQIKNTLTTTRCGKF